MPVRGKGLLGVMEDIKMKLSPEDKILIETSLEFQAWSLYQKASRWDQDVGTETEYAKQLRKRSDELLELRNRIKAGKSMDEINTIVRDYNNAVDDGERKRLYHAIIKYEDDNDPQPGTFECRYINYVLSAIDFGEHPIKEYDQWVQSLSFMR